MEEKFNINKISDHSTQERLARSAFNQGRLNSLVPGLSEDMLGMFFMLDNKNQDIIIAEIERKKEAKENQEDIFDFAFNFIKGSEDFEMLNKFDSDKKYHGPKKPDENVDARKFAAEATDQFMRNMEGGDPTIN